VEGFHPGHQGGSNAELLADQSEFPGEIDAGADPTSSSASPASTASPRRARETTPSLSIEMLRLHLGLDFTVVPFAGGGPMVQSLLGGHTPIACSAIGNAMSLVRDGKIRVLAITAKKRLETARGNPHAGRSRHQGQEARDDDGRVRRGRNAKGDRRSLQKEIAAIVTTPDIKARLLELGVVPKAIPRPSSPLTSRTR